MASRIDLREPDDHSTCNEISLSDSMKTFTFRCGNIVIRLTCNEPSKRAVDNFQAALHVILHSMVAESSNEQHP